MKLTCEEVDELLLLVASLHGMAEEDAPYVFSHQWEETEPTFDKWFERLHRAIQPEGEAGCGGGVDPDPDVAAV